MTTLPFKVPGIDDLRAVRFNFGGDGDGQYSVPFDGFTDDTTWNGWLNVYIKVETYREQIRPLFVGPDGSSVDDLGRVDDTVSDLDGLTDKAAREGTLVSLANCFTTLEVQTPEEVKEEEILGDLLDDDPPVCPECQGDAYLLGSLGTTKHFRCRDCGWTFS